MPCAGPIIPAKAIARAHLCRGMPARYWDATARVLRRGQIFAAVLTSSQQDATRQVITARLIAKQLLHLIATESRQQRRRLFEATSTHRLPRKSLGAQ